MVNLLVGNYCDKSSRNGLIICQSVSYYKLSGNIDDIPKLVPSYSCLMIKLGPEIRGGLNNMIYF